VKGLVQSRLGALVKICVFQFVCRRYYIVDCFTCLLDLNCVLSYHCALNTYPVTTYLRALYAVQLYYYILLSLIWVVRYVDLTFKTTFNTPYYK
jgi:hypothetical protein